MAQECPKRVLRKSVLQECRTRGSSKSVPQGCARRVSSNSSRRVQYKAVKKERRLIETNCPTRVSYKSVARECQWSIKSLAQEGPKRVHDCPTIVCPRTSYESVKPVRPTAQECSRRECQAKERVCCQSVLQECLRKLYRLFKTKMCQAIMTTLEHVLQELSWKKGVPQGFPTRASNS